jgi:hypothetical protein
MFKTFFSIPDIERRWRNRRLLKKLPEKKIFKNYTVLYWEIWIQDKSFVAPLKLIEILKKPCRLYTGDRVNTLPVVFIYITWNLNYPYLQKKTVRPPWVHLGRETVSETRTGHEYACKRRDEGTGTWGLHCTCIVVMMRPLWMTNCERLADLL